MAFQYGMLMQLSMLLVLLLAATNAVAAATTRTSAREGGADDGKPGGLMAKLNCTAICGNVPIPYPFGIGDNPRCYFDPRFQITCKESNNESEPTEPRLMETRMLVTSISLEEGELQTGQLVNRVCFDSKGNPDDSEDQSKGGLSVIPPYTISGDKNMLVAVGCDTFVLFVGSRDDQNYTTGCFSRCQKNISSTAIDQNDSCSGMGCCQTKIPPLLHNLTLTVSSFINHRLVRDFNPCGYAFVVRNDSFTFSNTSFQELRNTARLPLVLDWQIGEESCPNAMQNKTYACKGNSVCHNKTSGYICRCSPGFRGNPYLEDSCQDIDECALNATLCEHGKCINQVGHYNCSCNSGYHNHNDITCIKDPNAKRLKISLGVSLSFSVLVVAILGIYRERRKSRLKKLKDKYFDANGGVLLQEKMASLGNTARLFTENDIKATTNNYDKGKKVGEGSYGIVYKGILEKQVVAIKKSRVSAPIDPNQNTDPVDQEQITACNQFRNEINALYQINHTNVVRLIGCCLETPTPILVYEFMSKGPIYENIHGQNGKKPSSPLTLAQRLKIAAETAGALAYLHHFAVPRFIHRGVNTTNILLDKNLTAKLSGFGASTPVFGDENEKEKKEKSDDIYSFGLVLVELLTSLKAEEKEVKLFVRSVEGRTLRQTLDEEIWEDRFDKEITKAAELTKKCLNAKAEERPSMKDVASDLQELLRTMPQHPSGGVEDDISPSPKDTGN